MFSLSPPLGSCALLTRVVVFICFMPETKGRSLESVDMAFETLPLRKLTNKVSHRRGYVNDETTRREQNVDIGQNM